MATLSSILAWKIPWTEEPGGLQSMKSQRVRHGWVTEFTIHNGSQIPVFSVLFCFFFFFDALYFSRQIKRAGEAKSFGFWFCFWQWVNLVIYELIKNMNWVIQAWEMGIMSPICSRGMLQGLGSLAVNKTCSILFKCSIFQHFFKI